MIKSIDELGFKKGFLDFIKDVEDSFNSKAKDEHTKMTMLEWINDNIEQIKDDGLLDGLSDREKFIFAIVALLCSLAEE